MKPEIIKALKENTSAFGLMSPELQKAAKEIERSNFQVWECVMWKNVIYNYLKFNPNETYRLRSDYWPEPEYVKFEIFPHEDGLMYEPHVSCQNYWPECALRNPNFFKFEDNDGKQVFIDNIANSIRQGKKCYAVFVKE